MKMYLCTILPILAIWAPLKGCRDKPVDYYQGYLHADLVYVAAPVNGRLQELHIDKGVAVYKGDPLFRLEDKPDLFSLNQAQELVKQAEANLADLKKGARNEELQVQRDLISQARAEAELAALDVIRIDDVFSNQFVSASDHDQAIYSQRKAEAVLQAAQDTLVQMNMPARQDQIDAAMAAKNAQQFNELQQEWYLDEKVQRSIYDAIIYDILFRPGEWVVAGQPVVALLVPEFLKARFYVRTEIVDTLALNHRVKITQPGTSGKTVYGRISYISSVAEYTPPVIFSRDNSTKQVFMIEAMLDKPEELFHPGLPVEVRVAGDDPE